MSSDTGPSRRVVLLAALGLATATTGFGGCSATDGPIPSEGVLSNHFGVEAPRWRLAVPRASRPRGLVVALHGFGGGADDAFNLGFGDAVEPTRMALVSVDGGNSYWHPRRDGSDTGAMVRDELVPMALEACRLPPSSPVVLLGWSMGGFGALLIASELGRPRVSGVVAASAALWRKGSETPARAYDGRADFDRHSVFNRLDRLRGIPVRLDCGAADPFIAANRLLAQRLPGSEAHFTPGGHDDDFWRGNISAEMTWAAARS
ncbi:alpha/beta hydrolase-fold protein [Terrabacter sp. Ter38]|uniref:alpha/beta hydrolase-fold protein n=1 Tax=Terrabacter sp. Ter38 TaxID=2926030 RepID=UPI002119626D|nr:alpha/beta hydrolase-fold protein [Terrabacter sp. Ter38]